MIDGDEYDALTKWRHYLNWKNGARRKTKTRFNRRIRKDAKLAIHKENSSVTDHEL